MTTRRRFLAGSLASLTLGSDAFAVPPEVGQVVVSLADSWHATRGRLMAFTRSGPRAPWQPSWRNVVPVLFGKGGLAWGNGVLPVPHGQGGIPSKREKDGRAPAGCFRIGMLFGEAATAPAGVSIPYYRVTARDCWIDDPTHPAYNKHIVVDPQNPPPFYAKQRMRLGDSAYEYLLEVRHNADPPVAGHGSAIFFHVRRGPNRLTAGCTTMAREDLLQLLRTLKREWNPHYVLLPVAEYRARLEAWRLPAVF
jgi:L,D-peptidoglycan transpeptidase YkuD (ErfK/YbiS/YcfS/YnhG family)